MTTANIIGAGPAGLMAAEVLAQAGVKVTIYDAMPSAGRKFLLAGIGGLNLTHSEPEEDFLSRFGAAEDVLTPLLKQWGAKELRAWAKDLGTDTFIGTSGRVFPKEMKAAPLLRAWLTRLRILGVITHMRHRWIGFDDGGKLQMDHQGEVKVIDADATVLACGGGSWPKLGSDGAWQTWLRACGVQVNELKPANCGFNVNWSEHFTSHFAGHAFKTIALNFQDFAQKGECISTSYGIEGSLIYAASARLRAEIEASGGAQFTLDLLPDWDFERVLREVSHPRGSRSLTNHLKSRLGLEGIKLNLLYECGNKNEFVQSHYLAKLIKNCPITVHSARPIAEAISSAGGVCFPALNTDFMLKKLPGVFCAGEMLDWEAPTGGYLLTATMSTGRAAGLGAMRYLGTKN